MTTNRNSQPMPVSAVLELDSTKAVILALRTALDSADMVAVIETAARHEGLNPDTIDPDDDSEANLELIDRMLEIEQRMISVVLIEAMERAGIDSLNTDDRL